MIRKPLAGWQREGSKAVTTIRAAGEFASGSARVALRGGHVAKGVFCYFFAALWGFAGLAGGLATGSLPTLIGVGAMAGFMFWAGRRAFAKAREVSA